MTKAFVLLSGGIDSGTCLALAVRDCGAQNVIALSVDYGQRHLKETEYAYQQTRHWGVRHLVVPLQNTLPSVLTDKNEKVPDTSYDKIDGVSPMYVPFRNGQLLSLIAGYAHGRLVQEEKEFAARHARGIEPSKDNLIYFGAHAEDAARWAYPDCTPEFIGAMANAIYVGTYGQLRLKTPLEHLVKREIIELGQKAGVPWDLTWSCYKGDIEHCGTCATCQSRRQGFVDAHVQDPTRYMNHSANTRAVL